MSALFVVLWHFSYNPFCIILGHQIGLLLTILNVPKKGPWGYEPNVLVFPDHLRRDKQKGVQILVLPPLGTHLRVYKSGKAKEANRQRSSLEGIVSMVCGPFHSSCCTEWCFHIVFSPIQRVLGDHSESFIYFL